MLNINQRNVSLDFNFSTHQLKEIISTEYMEVIFSDTDEYYDSDEVINIDEIEMEKLYLCL
jgi:hypothetical protein